MKNPAITRTVWILSLISLFADISSEMLYPVVPVYLRSIGFSFFLIGLLEGIAETTAGLSKGSFGHWSDHYGKRTPFIRVGYFLSACSKPMMAMMSYPLWVFFSRMVDRLGKGLRSAPRDALLSLESTPQTKAQVFGFHRALDTIGAVVGPALALCYLHWFGGDMITLFYLAFVPGLVSVAISMLIKETSVQDNSKPAAKVPGIFSYFSYWKRATKSYRSVLVPMILFALFNSSDMFLLLQVKEMSNSLTVPLLAYITYNIVYAVAAYPLGLLADRIGMRRVVVVGLLLFVCCYVAVTLAHTLPAFALIFCFYGLGMAAIESNVKAWLCNLVPAADVGTAVGLFASLQSMSLFFASTVAGLLWSSFGATVTFVFSAAAAACACALLVFKTSSGRVAGEL